MLPRMRGACWIGKKNEEEDFEDDEDFGMPGVPFFWTNPSSDD